MPPPKQEIMSTPRDLAFTNAILGLRTRRDATSITTNRLLGNGGIQFSGFRSMRFRRLQSVLAQFDKGVRICPGPPNTILIRCFDPTRVPEPLSLGSLSNVSPEHGLIPDTSNDFEHTSVERKAFSYESRSDGIDMGILVALTNIPTVLDVDLTHDGIYVYSLVPNNLSQSLYNVVREWKTNPHSGRLRNRPSKLSAPLKRKRRKKQRT